MENHQYLRSLQQSREDGRESAITIVYLIVLASCIIIPFCYYLRLRRAERIQRTQERDHMTAMENSVNETSRDENRATRKKMRAEKRARIRQLFIPVKVTLTLDHFRGTGTKENEGLAETDDGNDEKVDLADEESGVANSDSHSSRILEAPETVAPVKEVDMHPSIEKGMSDDGETIPDDSSNEFVVSDYREKPDMPYIELPVQGMTTHMIQNDSDELDSQRETRLVPNDCAICLSSYEVGDHVVWSSNPKCEHAFHEECIEKWLMKLRADPLCPCCRRDFIIDPLDIEIEDGVDVTFGYPAVIDFEEEEEEEQEPEQALRS